MAEEAEVLVANFVADLRREQQQQQKEQQQPPPQQPQQRLLLRPPPRVEIATSPSSALCRTALLLLEDLDIPYRELQIGRDINEAQLVLRKGGPFVLLPLIFVDDRFVGGYAELKALAAHGADAVLGSGEPTSLAPQTIPPGNTTPPRAASLPIFERLHCEAESIDARRAALQRHGLEYGLHSPMSPERAPPAPRPQSPLHPTVSPRFNSPNRDLVSQERSGVGIRAIIRTDRAGMRYDSVHSAVRCGGGWDLDASSSFIERDGNSTQRRSRSPAYSPRRRRRRSPGRIPAPAQRSQPDTGHGTNPQPQLNRPAPEPEPEPHPRPRPRPALRNDEQEAAQMRIQQRLQAVGNRLAALRSGVRIGTSSTAAGEVALIGLDGEIITSAPPQSTDGNDKLSLLLQLLEGACDRVENEDEDDDSSGGGRQQMRAAGW